MSKGPGVGKFAAETMPILGFSFYSSAPLRRELRIFLADSLTHVVQEQGLGVTIVRVYRHQEANQLFISKNCSKVES